MYHFINIGDSTYFRGRRLEERKVNHCQDDEQGYRVFLNIVQHISFYKRFVRKSKEHFLYLHVLAGINNELKEKSTFYDKK